VPDGGFKRFDEAPSPGELSRLPANDWGNGMRLIRLAGGVASQDGGPPDVGAARLLYLSGSGWIGFNGKYWDRDHGEGLARILAHDTARGLFDQRDHIEDDEYRKLFGRFARESGNSGRTTAMLAQAQPYLTVGLEEFDRDPLVLNVRNGTLRFRRVPGDAVEVKLRPHDPADRLTRMADVDYDPGATAPLFERTVAQAQPDDAMRSYLQRCLGYCATGEVREQVMFICQGKGRDSKSTVVDAVRETLGTYGVVASVVTFMDEGVRGGADASPDLARLAGGVRLVSIPEPKRGARLNEGLVKSWTSGAPIVARELRQSIFEFEPIGKLVLECNPLPEIRNDDDGTWRRLMIVPFRRQVPVEQIDRTLKHQLRGEHAGILNWLIAGIGAWMSEGLAPPPDVLDVLDDYRRGSSPFGEWFTDRVELDPEATTKAAEFYKDYTSWCEENGIEKPMSTTMFGRALRDRQIIRVKTGTKGLVYRKGAKLKPRWDPPAAAPDAPSGEPGAGGSSPQGTSPDDWGFR
jgi:putative DNA primase/helicase